MSLVICILNKIPLPTLFSPEMVTSAGVVADRSMTLESKSAAAAGLLAPKMESRRQLDWSCEVTEVGICRTPDFPSDLDFLGEEQEGLFRVLPRRGMLGRNLEKTFFW